MPLPHHSNMAPARAAERDLGIPEGYLAIPISESDKSAPLRVCVLARKAPDSAAGALVLLRELHDGRVFLGCVIDAGGYLREWLELWVQNVDGLETSLPVYRESFSNFSLDARWAAQAEAFRSLRPGGFLSTGFEAEHPHPTFLDLSQAVPVQPSGPEHGTWELCRDDKLLQAAGLPAYHTSLFRYLYQSAAGPGSKFISVTAGAPESSQTSPLSHALKDANHHVAFNPQAGQLMAMTLAPLSFDDYADLLGGKSWPGIEHGKKRIQFNGPYQCLGEWTQAQQDGAHLFLGAQGRAGRFVETFHLKLELLTEAVRQVRSFVQQRQLPFLNLNADSFRVSLEDVGTGLPILWTAKCSLVKPGNAFELPVATSDFKYFIRPGGAGASIYLPEGISAHLQGTGSVRIRKVLPPESGQTVLEGTLVVHERLPVSENDLLWIRLPLPSGRLDLYGHLYAAESLAQGEVRFRTVPQTLSESVLAALHAAEGVSFARSPFEVVPLLSSPCDLFSLGVLAVRALLVDEKNTLPVALDEVLSLARQVASEHSAEVPLGGRVRSILQRDARYAISLGPHRLTREGVAPEVAPKWVPLDTWCDTLAVMVSLFPGLGPDSVCRDFGDVPALALETCFNRPLDQLEKLLIRTRALVVVDWASNHEIHSAIRRLLDH